MAAAGTAGVLVASQFVVPVVGLWEEPLDGRVAFDHVTTRVVACLVVVEAAVDLVAAIQEGIKPGCGRANARRRDADARSAKLGTAELSLQLETTDGVNRGFAEHDLLRACLADPEIACVLTGSRRETTPDAVSRASQLGADWTIGLACHHQEHGIAAVVSVQPASIDQRCQDLLGETPLLAKVLAHPLEVRGTRRRQAEL